MADRFLGIPLVSREQRRQNAKIALAFFAAMIVLGLFVVYYIALMEQRGYRQALATVKALEAECRYVVSNVAKRSKLYDHTGYVDCATAEQVARDNDFALGRVERSALATVDFMTEAGQQVSSQVRLFKQVNAEVGQQVEILYRETSPADIKEFKSFPLFGMSSIAPKSDKPTAAEIAANEAAAAKSEARKKRIAEKVAKREIDPVGLVILIVMLVIAFFALRWLWRKAKSLIGGGNTASVSPRPTQRQPAATVSASRPDRISRTLQRSQRQGFGQR